MIRILVACRPDAPDPSDVLPLLVELRSRGHEVVVLATEDHRGVASAADAAFRLLPPVPVPAARSASPGRLRALRQGFRAALTEPLRAHWPVVQQVIAEEQPQVVVADALAFAACMVAELPRSARPPVVVLGTIPPPHAHPGAAPYGLGLHPDASVLNRARNALLHLVTRRVLMRPVLAELQTLFLRLSGQVMERDTYDAAQRAEVWAQCEPERFEYPLAAAGNLRLVGPLTACRTALLPDWWDPADRRPIVMARIAAGADPAVLIVPLLAALRGSGLHLVLSGAGRRRLDAALIDGLPADVDVDVAETLPAAQVLPGTAVVVARGHFVHVQHALQQGVPVIAFGTGLEEAETGARMEWHGCGVRLRTERPDAAALRAAVTRAIGDPGLRQAAARIAAQASRSTAESTVASLVERAVRDAEPVR